MWQQKTYNSCPDARTRTREMSDSTSVHILDFPLFWPNTSVTLVGYSHAQKHAYSRQKEDIPSWKSGTPSNRNGTFPKKSGILSKKSGTFSRISATFSKKYGTFSEKSGLFRELAKITGQQQQTTIRLVTSLVFRLLGSGRLRQKDSLLLYRRNWAVIVEYRTFVFPKM